MTSQKKKKRALDSSDDEEEEEEDEDKIREEMGVSLSDAVYVRDDNPLKKSIANFLHCGFGFLF